MEISIVASGSNGNSTLVENKSSAVLIDAGLSCKEIEARLNRMGKSLEQVDGIILTHGHIDHYRGIGPVARQYNIPVYLTKQVYEQCQYLLGTLDIKQFSLNKPFKINSMSIKPVRTSHDMPNCGFVIGKFGLFTDTGKVTPGMKKAMANLQGVLIESNHDIDMLLDGRYPYFLKQRILSDTGHLSNIHCSQFVQALGKNLSWALLGHLSGNNNTPAVAADTFSAIVKRKVDSAVLSREKESGVWGV